MRVAIQVLCVWRRNPCSMTMRGRLILLPVCQAGVAICAAAVVGASGRAGASATTVVWKREASVCWSRLDPRWRAFVSTLREFTHPVHTGHGQNR